MSNFGDERERVPVDGVGVFVGVVAAFVLVYPCILLGQLGLILAVAAVVGAMVLIAAGGPFAKGVGTGLLITGAILALLVGTCFAMLAGSDL